jgi:DNA-binding NtrC family response regulator
VRSDPPALCVVDPDDARRSAVTAELERMGYVVHGAAGADEARQAAGRVAQLDLTIVDAALPGAGALLKELAARHPDMATLYLGAPAKPVDIGRVIEDPLDPGELLSRVRNALYGRLRGPA